MRCGRLSALVWSMLPLLISPVAAQNSVTVEQDGDGLSGSIDQTAATGSSVDLLQDGGALSALISQEGGGHRAVVSMFGEGHDAALTRMYGSAAARKGEFSGKRKSLICIRPL